MNRLFLILLALTAFLASCSERDDSVDEYAQWSERNEAAFTDTLRLARTAIAQARAAHGADWSKHTSWRAFRSYTNVDGAKTSWRDSIIVRVLQTGTGSGTPLYTDSVRIVYVGRLMPTTETPAGYVFDRSGLSSELTEAFRPEFARTKKFAVSNMVEGMTTALQQMHIGDRWRVFIPADMGYGSAQREKIPAGSMLIFDLELHSYWRK